MGWLLVWQFVWVGYCVCVVDFVGGFVQFGVVGFMVVGMFSLLVEQEYVDFEVVVLGWCLLKFWLQIVEVLGQFGFVKIVGSLLFVYVVDQGVVQCVFVWLDGGFELLDCGVLQVLEFVFFFDFKVWWLFGEGQLLLCELLVVLVEQVFGVDWYWGCCVMMVQVYVLWFDDGSCFDVDFVIDMCGFGVCFVMLCLCGVCGEILWLYVLGVVLNCFVWLMYLCYCVYFVFRLGDVIVVGVLEVESEDCLFVSLCSVVELMVVVQSVLLVLVEVCIVYLEINLCLVLLDYKLCIEQ